MSDINISRLDYKQLAISKNQIFWERWFCLVLFICSENVYFKHNDATSAVFEIVLLISGIILYMSIPFSKGRKRWLIPITIFLINAIILFCVVFSNLENTILSNLAQKIVLFCILLPLIYSIFQKLGFVYVTRIFLRRYINILFVFGVIGVFLWIFMNLGINLPSITVNYYWGSSNTFSGVLGLVFPIQDADQGFLPLQLYRYTLFYVEGGVAAGYFIIGTILELAFNPTPRLTVALVLTLCAMCSLSTYGLIAAPVFFILGIFASPRMLKRIRSAAIKLGIFYMSIAIVIALIPSWIIFSINNKQNVGSLAMHLAGYVAGLKAFLARPFTGWGIGNYSAMNQFDSSAGWTSPLMMGLTQGGILYVLLVLCPFFLMLFKSARKKNWSYSYFSIIMISLYVNGNTDNAPIFVCMMSLSYLYALNKDFLKS